MNGTQAIELHKIFKRHKFTDRETNQIIEFVENQNGDLLTKKDLRIEIEPLKRDIGWIKWVLGFVIALIIGLAGAVYYLHSDTKSDIREMRTEIREIKALIKSENK